MTIEYKSKHEVGKILYLSIIILATQEISRRLNKILKYIIQNL